MGQSGHPLTTIEKLQILRAVAHVSTFGDRRELSDIARQYSVSLTTVKRVVRGSLSRAVAIFEREHRIAQLLEEDEDHGS